MRRGALSFIFILILSFPLNAGLGFIFPQQVENHRIDQLLKEASDLYQDEKFDEALEIYKSAEELSKSEKYSKGLAQAYLGMSGVYFVKGKLDVSTSYILKAKNQSYTSQNDDISYSIAFREGLNLHMLGLYDDAVKKYKEAIAISNRVKNQEDRVNKLIGIYINIGDVYQLKKQNDSALYYYKSAYHSPSTNVNNKFTSSVSISEVYIENNELDSGKIYLNYAENYSKSLGTNYSKALLKEISGKYYEASGDLQNAISSFENAIQLNEEINRPRVVLYKLLSETYHKKGDSELSNSYLKQYVAVKDSVDEARKRNIKVPAMLAQTDGEIKVEKANANVVLIFVISGVLIAVILSGVFVYSKKQKRKNLKGKKENLQLKKKLNNAFEEVVELATSNSPNFLSRFIEVYPEFYSQLVNDYPDLTTADLKLCALMKLDFSTKEIAEMTFSSLRTVQNRKYKLRKKFNLSSEENLNQWIQNLHVESLTMV